jgi:hypothetical protein
MRVLCFIVLSFLCAGCMATGTKVTEEQLFQFRRGHTTFYDVVASLGKPTQTTRHADGTREVWYSYTQQQLRAENFIPVVAMFTQGATAETTTVYLTFDAADRLVSYSASQGQSTTGYGLSSGGRQ